MTIENLRSAIHPPDRPDDAFDGPWEEIEALLRVPALPADYKDLCREYGYLYYFQFMSVCIPRTKHPNLRLESIVYEVISIQKALGVPRHLVWPAPGALLPFGSTDNGDYLFWLTRGHPDEWGVVVWDRGFGDYEFLECDLTDFLAGLATGAIRPRGLPDDLSESNPVED